MMNLNITPSFFLGKQYDVISRRKQILKLMADGEQNKQICAMFKLSIRTIEHDVLVMMKQNNCFNRVQLIATALRKWIIK